jgi:hypothetical protein
MGAVRNFLLILLVAAAGYWYANRHHGLDHADYFAGAWSREFIRESTPGTMTLYLEADGSGSLRLNYVQQGQNVFREAPGQWQSEHNRFSFTFSGATPDLVDAGRFAGRIITLDERQLQFKSSTGIESWSRAR